ncbi:hypothetical protein niasHS_002261 [Heterodera schachtii]|uniref:Uncharacterized protein n=2 Tax=Heterodera TaxID=34509 RepID=A0ABD2KMR8_HETSC
MSSLPIVRSQSTSYIGFPRARDFAIGDGHVPSLSRVTSVPNLNHLHVSDAYRSSTLYKYRRDWDLLDSAISDYSHRGPGFHWVDRRFRARRFMNTDPIPDSLGLDYPNFWSRYKWYSDYLEPRHWRRHRDPNYDRPLWNSWKPYILDGKNQKQAIDMYRQGLVSFAYLDKNWITPWALGRKEKDWADIYPPAGKYGSRRYMYSWA